MQLALAQPRRVSALVVADIAPVDYPPHHDGVFAALEAVAAGQCSSRAEAAGLMAAHLHEEQVVQFLLTSLRRDPDGVHRWRFNLRGSKRGYGAVRSAPTATAPYRGRCCSSGAVIPTISRRASQPDPAPVSAGSAEGHAGLWALAARPAPQPVQQPGAALPAGPGPRGEASV